MMPVYSKSQTQIEAQSGVQIRVLLFDKAPSKILAKYSNYSNVFLVKNAVELLENTEIRKHAIELKEDKQILFRPIYSLELMK